ncbi:hypothetical protein ES703_38237 [subsurface metagenome]
MPVHPDNTGPLSAKLAIYNQGFFISRQLFLCQKLSKSRELLFLGEGKDTFDLGLVGPVADNFLVGFAG